MRVHPRPIYSRPELWLALLVALSLALVAASNFVSWHRLNTDREFGRKLSEVRFRIAVSHLWAEETTAGDKTANKRNAVMENYLVAQTQCTELRHSMLLASGNWLRHDQSRLHDTINTLCRRVDNYDVFLRMHLTNPYRARAGGPWEQRCDREFGHIVYESAAARAIVRDIARDDSNTTRYINIALAALLSALIAGLALSATRHRREVRALDRQRELLLDSAGEGIVRLDREGALVFANASAARMLRTTVEALVGQPHNRLHLPPVGSRPCDPASCDMLATALDGTERSASDQRMWRADGSTFPVEYVATPLLASDEAGGAVVVFRDVTERRAVEQMRSEFVAIASHELRTPVTSLKGALTLLSSGVAKGEEAQVRKLLEVALDGADRLAGLTDDILDVQRLESGTLVLRRRLCDARALVQQAVAATARAAAARGVAVRVTAQHVWVDADQHRVAQVVEKLVRNAIAFSPEGSTVDVRVIGGVDEATFHVEDRGPGLALDQREHVFEPFCQADSSDSRRHNGTGLGLTIARGVVLAHGGRIWVKTEAGAGATFSFTLPIMRAARYGDTLPNGSSLTDDLLRDNTSLGDDVLRDDSLLADVDSTARRPRATV